jgi:hypothetical protein
MPEPTSADSKPESSKIAPPAISLPKGGGAIRGMGEKFAADPATDISSMSVSIAASPSRGFGLPLLIDPIWSSFRQTHVPAPDLNRAGCVFDYGDVRSKRVKPLLLMACPGLTQSWR